MYNVSSCLFFAEADKGHVYTTVSSKYHEEAYDACLLRAFVLFNGKLLR